jgi:hypothetical protein
MKSDSVFLLFSPIFQIKQGFSRNAPPGRPPDGVMKSDTLRRGGPARPQSGMGKRRRRVYAAGNNPPSETKRPPP